MKAVLLYIRRAESPGICKERHYSFPIIPFLLNLLRSRMTKPEKEVVGKKGAVGKAADGNGGMTSEKSEKERTKGLEKWRTWSPLKRYPFFDARDLMITPSLGMHRVEAQKNGSSALLFPDRLPVVGERGDALFAECCAYRTPPFGGKGGMKIAMTGINSRNLQKLRT
ncbi:MAG: hypothetical protein ABEH38_04925 [Flavobacteriales bacterium]